MKYDSHHLTQKCKMHQAYIRDQLISALIPVWILSEVTEIPSLDTKQDAWIRNLLLLELMLSLAGLSRNSSCSLGPNDFETSAHVEARVCSKLPGICILFCICDLLKVPILQSHKARVTFGAFWVSRSGVILYNWGHFLVDHWTCFYLCIALI